MRRIITAAALTFGLAGGGVAMADTRGDHRIESREREAIRDHRDHREARFERHEERGEYRWVKGEWRREGRSWRWIAGHYERC